MLGCSGAPSKSRSASEENLQILHYANLSEPEYLDPAKMSDQVSSNIGFNTFEGLTDFDPKTLKPIPAIATHWKVSKQGKVYTFYLRQNAKWSDGSNVTAHDFVYSWQRVVDPKTASGYAFIMYDIKNAKAINHGKITDLTKMGVSAIDNYTLRVELEYSVPYFPELTAWYTYRPVKKEVVEKYAERWTLPENFVGNGYFTLSEWIPQKQITVLKNPHYWDKDNVRLDKVIFYPIEDQDTALKKYLKGEVHYVQDLPDIKLNQLRKRDDYHEDVQLAVYQIILNMARPEFADKKFRQALAHSIDRRQLVKLINKGVASDTYIPKGFPDYIYPKGLAFNPEKARELLKQSVYGESTEPITLTISYNTSKNHKQIMEILQNMWKRHLGIAVKMVNMEWKVFLKMQSSKDFQMCRFTWAGDYMDPNTFLSIYRSNSGSNYISFNNATYDSLLDHAQQTFDKKKRYALYKKAEEILLDESGIIPLYSYTGPFLLSNDVVGIYGNLLDVHPLKSAYLKQQK